MGTGGRGAACRKGEAMTEDEEDDLDNSGFCMFCGEEVDYCELDARKYRCEACGMHTVDRTLGCVIKGDVQVVSWFVDWLKEQKTKER